MPPKLDDLIRLARGAGEILRGYFFGPLTVSHKGSADLVTEADEHAERFIVDGIRAGWPRHRIVAEESGNHEGDDSGLWFVDPLDGTTNFAHGLPIFSVSIAFATEGEVLHGVVYDPMRDEVFAATRGGGAWKGDDRLRVGDRRRLIDCLLVTGFPYDKGVNPANNLDYFSHFAVRSQGIRRLGSAALDLAYVAAGRVDAFWELRLQPWDIAAGVLIAEEAGARVTRMDGEPDVMRKPCSVLAANPALHGLMLDEALAIGAGNRQS